MRVLCHCGRPGRVPLARALFCDAEFRVKCELCTSELLDADAGGACARCARVVPAPHATDGW